MAHALGAALNYTAACTCSRAFMCSASHWKLAVSQSPSVWIRAVFPGSEFPQRRLELDVCFLGGRIILIKWVRCKNSYFICEDILTFKQPPDPKNFHWCKRMLVPTSDYFLSLGIQYIYLSGPSSNDVMNVIMTFCGRFRWSRSLQEYTVTEGGWVLFSVLCEWS